MSDGSWYESMMSSGAKAKSAWSEQLLAAGGGVGGGEEGSRSVRTPWKDRAGARSSA
jgi:hypothetical protein